MDDENAGRLTTERLLTERAALLDALPAQERVRLADAVAAHRRPGDAARPIAAEPPLIVMPAAEQTVESQIRVLSDIWFAGADILVTEPDGYSLQGRHELARAAVDHGEGTLDGVPAAAVGVAGLRRITSASPGPSEAVVDCGDPRLLADLFLAGGFGSLAGGVGAAVARRPGAYPASEAVTAWRFVEALCGHYTAAGVPITRVYRGAGGPDRATECALLVLDALFAAEQGVRHVVLELRSSLRVAADAAAVIALDGLARDRLGGSAESGVQLAAATGGGADEFEHLASTHIAAVTALGVAARLRLEGPRQLQGLPDAARRAALVRTVHATRHIARGRGLPVSGHLVRQADEIRAEAGVVLDRMVSGTSDLAAAVAAASDSYVRDEVPA